jgi:lysophospholipase L1-like esterase
MVEAQPEVVAGAEIVVLWGNPENLPIKPGHHNCVESSDRPAGISDPGSYTVSDWAPFADAFGRTLDAIWKARQNQPTIVRVTDLCVPVYRDWKRAGIFDACLRMWEAQSAAIREAAEQHGAVMVSAFDVYNGKNHDEDPVTKGLIQEDGIHPSQAGGRAMAEALAAAGFTPTRR